MQIRKNTKYCLIEEGVRDKLVIVLHELWKKACHDKYVADDPEGMKAASRAADIFYELEDYLKYAESGVCIKWD